MGRRLEIRFERSARDRRSLSQRSDRRNQSTNNPSPGRRANRSSDSLSRIQQRPAETASRDHFAATWFQIPIDRKSKSATATKKKTKPTRVGRVRFAAHRNGTDQLDNPIPKPIWRQQPYAKPNHDGVLHFRQVAPSCRPCRTVRQNRRHKHQRCPGQNQHSTASKVGIGLHHRTAEVLRDRRRNGDSDDCFSTGLFEHAPSDSTQFQQRNRNPNRHPRLQSNRLGDHHSERWRRQNHLDRDDSSGEPLTIREYPYLDTDRHS